MTDEDYLIVTHLTTKQLTRIFRRIKIDRETGCWECTRNLNAFRHGRFNYKGRAELAHRLMYAWLIEPLPRNKGKGDEKLELDHFVCDNPPCCNPVHLRLGTQRQNMLRGNSPSAIHARKTHCIHGHLLPLTSNRTDGRRRCITCERESESRRPPRPNRYIKKTDRPTAQQETP